MLFGFLSVIARIGQQHQRTAQVGRDLFSCLFFHLAKTLTPE
jgi:hypothetical protein